MQIGEWNKIRASHIIPKYPQAYFHKKKKNTHTNIFAAMYIFIFIFATVFVVCFRFGLYPLVSFEI